MAAESDHAPPGSSSYLLEILDAPEDAGLRRLTTLVEDLFQVPVAYMALLGKSSEVVTRIGSGIEYAPILKLLQMDRSIEEPLLLRDTQHEVPIGTDAGELRFAASAPLRTLSGLCLGALVIADRVPRPRFSTRDAGTLADLASVLAGKMELRMIAAVALESELSLRESEEHYRSIANSVPALLFCSRADGGCSFVNQAWLAFSGREIEEELEDGWAELIHRDYREPIIEGYWRAFERQGPFSTECPLRRYDGQYRWVVGRGAPRFRANGEFAGYIACLLDISNYGAGPADSS